MLPQVIDSHAHLTDEKVYTSLPDILNRAKEANLTQIINICTDKKTLERGLELHQKEPWICNTAATTPHDVDQEGESFFPIVAEKAKAGKLVAIGETGLDYYYEHSQAKTQQTYLVKYLHLALEVNLPIVIHCREAFEDLFSILDAEYKNSPAILHCFTGNLKEAENVVKRGWYLSLSGIVTFKKSEELRQVAKMVPNDQLLVETDTPYLAPQSHRGKPNEPAYIQETVAMIAKVRGLEPEELAKQTRENAIKVFGLL